MSLFKLNQWWKFVSTLLITLLVTACGGGSDDPKPSPTPTSPPVYLSGTAAAGAAIVGFVIVKDSNGEIQHTEIAADGSYKVDVAGMKAPFRLRAEGHVGGYEYKLHSYAETATPDQTINITPFTDLIVANTAGQIASAYFESNQPANLDPQELQEQEEALQAKLEPVLSGLGLDASLDLMTTAFSADHTGLDAALDLVKVEVNEEQNIATITSFLAENPIVDALDDQDDNSGKLTVDPAIDIGETKTDLELISQQINAFSALFVNRLPTENELEPLIADTFLHDDMSKSEFISDITSYPAAKNFQFSLQGVEALNSEQGTALIYLQFKDLDEPNSGDLFSWYMSKSPSGKWLLNGSQEIVDLYVNFHCNRQYQLNGSDSYGGCGVNIGIEDSNPNNTPAPNQGKLISSARWTVKRDGEAIITGYLDDQWGLGELECIDDSGNHRGDWAGGFTDDFAATDFKSGDQVHIELFADNLSSLLPPQVTGEPVAEYVVPVKVNPVTSFNPALLPDFTTQTLEEMKVYQGGPITLTWLPESLPEGTYPSEISLDIWSEDGEIRLEVEGESIETDTNSVTLTINQDLLPEGVLLHKEFRFYADKSDQQSFSRFYKGTFIIGDELPAPEIPDQFTHEWLAGKTLYLLHYDGTKPIIKKQTYSDDGLEVTLTGELNSTMDGTYDVNITEDGVFNGKRLVCGSTEDYLKAHVEPNGNFQNVYLYFFEQSAAFEYADDLTGEIPACLSELTEAVPETVNLELGKAHQGVYSQRHDQITYILNVVKGTTYRVSIEDGATDYRDPHGAEVILDIYEGAIEGVPLLSYGYDGPTAELNKVIHPAEFTATQTTTAYIVTWSDNPDVTYSKLRVTEKEEVTPGLPEQFTHGWLAGRTLYLVYFDGEKPIIKKQIYSADGYQVTLTGELNSEEEGTYGVNITEDGVFNGKRLVCGSTEDYLKAHVEPGGDFKNVFLYFFNRDTAFEYANNLTEEIPPCESALPSYIGEPTYQYGFDGKLEEHFDTVVGGGSVSLQRNNQFEIHTGGNSGSDGHSIVFSKKLAPSFNQSWKIAVNATIPLRYNTDYQHDPLAEESWMEVGLNIINAKDSSDALTLALNMADGESGSPSRGVEGEYYVDDVEILDNMDVPFVSTNMETVTLMMAFDHTTKILTAYSNDTLVYSIDLDSPSLPSRWDMAETDTFRVGAYGVGGHVPVFELSPLTLDSFTYKEIE